MRGALSVLLLQSKGKKMSNQLEKRESTVSFVVRMYYRHSKRPSELPTYADFECDSFESMLALWSKESRRRALADAATSAEYRMTLTEYGQAKTAADADCAERHADATEGKWFFLHGYKWHGLQSVS